VSGPLAGVRVLDLTRLLPGGFCSLLLADFGADVLKVEDTGAGDYLRWTAPHVDGAHPSARSAPFLALNRGKRSIRIDLKQEGGREVLVRLARRSDVLLESFRPGVLDRLGVGSERLREENPRLVYCAVTGYGQTGPDRDRPGHDLNYLARNGVLGLTGAADGPPIAPAVQIADVGGGALTAAFGIMAALWERERSGVGQVVDVAMTAASQRWLAMVAAGVLAGAPAPARGTLDLAGGLACYRVYACADGWVALGALEEKFWRALCDGLERPDLVPHHLDPTVGAELERMFAARTRAEWAAFADAHPCCLEPVLDLDEALARAPEAVVTVEQPGTGVVRLLGAPFALSRTPAHDTRPAPALGEHTADVLADLGYASDDVAALEACGAVAGAPEAARAR